MGRQKRSAGQRRAAKVAARQRRGAGRQRSAPGLRPILTLPGLDGYAPDDLADERTDGVPELRLALAQSRAEAELGYRIPPVADPDDYPSEQLVEWAATVGRHHRAIVDADLDEDTCVTELVAHRLEAAVSATLAVESTGPARAEVAVLVASDGARSGRALRVAERALRERLAGAAEPGPALAWVAERLGADAAAAAAAVADVVQAGPAPGSGGPAPVDTAPVDAAPVDAAPEADPEAAAPEAAPDVAAPELDAAATVAALLWLAAGLTAAGPPGWSVAPEQGTLGG